MATSPVIGVVAIATSAVGADVTSADDPSKRGKYASLHFSEVRLIMDPIQRERILHEQVQDAVARVNHEIVELRAVLDQFEHEARTLRKAVAPDLGCISALMVTANAVPTHAEFVRNRGEALVLALQRKAFPDQQINATVTDDEHGRIVHTTPDMWPEDDPVDEGMDSPDEVE